MAWTYSQSKTQLTTPGGANAGNGYSGRGEGLNNPAMQDVPDQGPIPQGDWEIGEFFDDPGGKGPMVARLTPLPGTETFGRSGFMIHGDNALGNHTASEGCVILPRVLRQMIKVGPDRVLTVTA